MKLHTSALRDRKRLFLVAHVYECQKWRCLHCPVKYSLQALFLDHQGQCDLLAFIYLANTG